MKTIFSLLISALLGYFFLQAGYGADVLAQEGTHARGSFTKHFRETFFDITAKAKFSIEILPDDSEYKKLGKGVIGVVVHNSHDEDVEKATVTIDYRSLDTGGPAVEKPAVNERGEGLYTVSNLDLKKEGRWKLTITVKKGPDEDSVQFLFPEALKTRLPAGKYNP